MSKKVQIVIPMCGNGQRFFDKGFSKPKPLIELNGKPFFYWASISSLRCFNYFDSISFVVLKDHVKRFGIDHIIKTYFKNANIFVLENVCNGPAYTCLFAAKQLKQDLPIVFVDCDLAFSVSTQLNTFDSGLLFVFSSNDSSYSYIEDDNNGYVLRTKEKEVIGKYAICGAYYFSKTSDFIFEASKLINNGEKAEKYMSNIYNYYINDGKKISYCLVDWHLSFGTPDEYEIAKKSASLLQELENG